MNKRLVAIIITIAATMFITWYAVDWQGQDSQSSTENTARTTILDVSRLESVTVNQIVHVRSVEELQEAVQKAQREKLKVSIAGARHSQGGHIYYPGGVVLNMRGFNRVLKVNAPLKLMTVQSGATWAEIQAEANKHILAVKVMQASNIFTLGGSMSVNAHGRDPNFRSIIETIQSFRLLKPDGDIVNVSRSENADLFHLVIGGYGLFGVILDVDLELTDNSVYRKDVRVLKTSEYVRYFQNNVRGHSNIGLHFAWPSIASSKLLDEVLVADYQVTDERPKDIFELNEEEKVEISRLFLKLSRNYEWGKKFRWFMQKQLIGQHGDLLCRNNAMRPEVKFLDYNSPSDTDILQEYFFPISKFDKAIEGFKKIFLDNKINILSVTLRYVPPDKEPFLRYANSEESFALVLYINQKLSNDGKKEAAAWTQKLVDHVLSVGGNYYLPYQLYPTREQIRRAYPQIDEFFRLKKKHDPNELFVSKFYEHYR
jgi:decaprenylphospho-beta-D-ribofuranose 2-oxidase